MGRFELACELAHVAGRGAMEHYKRGKSPQIPKPGEKSDFYIQADSEADQIIKSGIRSAFPDDEILSEESAPESGTSGYRWIVDPVDGSIPLSMGFEGWGVSIGVTNWEKTVIGVVHTPAKGELFAAEIGSGTYLMEDSLFGDPVNLSTRIRIDGTGVVLDRAFIGIDYSKQRDAAEVRTTTGRLIDHIGYPLTFGSTAFMVGSLLAGRLHGIVHMRPDQYDMAGIDLLIGEAGGALSTHQGTRIIRGVSSSLVAACSPELHSQLVTLLQ